MLMNSQVLRVDWPCNICEVLRGFFALNVVRALAVFVMNDSNNFFAEDSRKLTLVQRRFNAKQNSSTPMTQMPASLDPHGQWIIRAIPDQKWT